MAGVRFNRHSHHSRRSASLLPPVWQAGQHCSGPGRPVASIDALGALESVTETQVGGLLCWLGEACARRASNQRIDLIGVSQPPIANTKSRITGALRQPE